MKETGSRVATLLCGISAVIFNPCVLNRYRKKLLSALRAYRPHEDLVPEVRILLVGPVGSGKSSFFNSVKSAFQGHLTHQAIVGSDEDSVTKQVSYLKICEKIGTLQVT